MYINIHSHQPPAGKEWVLQNRYHHFNAMVDEGCYSIGLHPWHIEAHSWLQQMNDVQLHSKKRNVLAIGECGLDKACTTSFALQQQVFEQQVTLAMAVNKPLVIHCVRAFNEVQSVLQKNKVTVPVIFHGFNKSKTLALQLTGRGYYLSFGKALQLPAVQQVMAVLPLQQVFLETDTAAFTIEEVYAVAATALSIDINALSLQIKKNAAAVFGNSILQV